MLSPVNSVETYYNFAPCSIVIRSSQSKIFDRCRTGLPPSQLGQTRQGAVIALVHRDGDVIQGGQARKRFVWNKIIPE